MRKLKLLLLTALMAVMCVGTSRGVNVAISTTDAAKSAVISDWLIANFGQMTITMGDYSNPANVPAGTQLLIISRMVTSSAYGNATNSATFRTMTIPIVCLTSYVARPDGSRWGWHSGGTNNGSGTGGNETTVTAAGAAVFGAAGTADWWSTPAGFNATGTGTVGTGKILATLGGNILVAHWNAGDVPGTGTVPFGSERLLFNIPDTDNLGMPGLPNTDAGQEAFRLALTAFTPLGAGTLPYDPMAIPKNPDGTVGTVDLTDMKVKNVDLTFKAGKDPNEARGLLVNPDIEAFAVYFQKNAPGDPNLYIINALDKGSQTDPNRLFPLSGYPEGALKHSTTYRWKVEQVLKNPATGLPYGYGDPNNINGPVWSFVTPSAQPTITAGTPYHTLSDTAGNATLAATVSLAANNFRWYKVVGVQDTQGGETNDRLLSNTTIDGVTYSNTNSATLGLSGMASDGSEDASYYLIAYNGVPGGGTSVASAPSAVAWVWYPRLVNHYAFDSTQVVDSNSFVVDSVSGFNAQLKSRDTGTDLPTLDSSHALGMGLNSTNSLYFNNPRANPADPNHVDGQYAQMNGAWKGYKDITISAWVYWNGGGTWQRIVDFGNSQQNHMNFQLNPGYPAPTPAGLQFEVIRDGNADARVYTAANAIPVNEWVHVSVTLTASTARLFIDGRYVAQDNSFPHDPINIGPTANNYISYSQYNGDWFNGYIDDLKIWNYALSARQVADVFLADDTSVEWVCNSEVDNLAYDWVDDCKIDVLDLVKFAETWLDTYRVYRE